MIDWREAAARAAAPGARRCALLVRHGERPPIAEDDPTFGETLGITDAGRALALACGRDVAAAGRPGDWAFAASPLRRTMLTAAAVAEGMGRAGAPVAARPEVGIPEPGVPSIWILDSGETFRNYRRLGGLEFNDAFVLGRFEGGYRPVAESTRLAMEWIDKTDLGARCAVVATHDVFLAALLNGLGKGPFDSRTRWVGFLQGCALFERPGGGWDADYVVPDKSAWRNTFLQ